MTTAKVLFVQALQAQATALAKAGAVLGDMAEVYVDRDYGTTNPFTAEDLAVTGLTVAQVTAMIAIVPAFLTFVNTAANRAALNDMRTDL